MRNNGLCMGSGSIEGTISGVQPTQKILEPKPQQCMSDGKWTSRNVYLLKVVAASMCSISVMRPRQ